MLNKFKIILSLLFLTVTPLLASSDRALIAEDFTILAEEPKIHPSCAVAPDKFTTKQYAELRTKNKTTEGPYTLALMDQKKFTSLQPSSLRFLTSQDASLVKRISKSTSYIDTTTTPPTLVAFYTLKGFYSSSSNNEFSVRSNVPIHGDEHLVTPGPVVYINVIEPFLDDREHTLAKLIGLIDGQIVRDTKDRSEHLLNQSVKNLLLIIAQQEGEDVLGLSKLERNVRASEIYYTLLGKLHLTLGNDTESLGIPLYERLIGGLINKLFYNAGIDISEIPTDLELARSVWISQMDRNHNPLTEGVKYLVPFKAISNHVIRKDISSLHAPKARLKSLGDRNLVQLERVYQANRFTFPTAVLSDLPQEAQSSVLWTVMRWGVIDPIEREAVAQITGMLATQMGEHLPYGKAICHSFLALSNALGRKRVADLAVDTAHGFIQPSEIVEEGLFSNKGLEAMDKSAECLVGLLPCGGLVYAGGKFLVKFAGYETPIHMVRGQKTLANGKVAKHTDRALQGTAEMLRQGTKMFIPGGALLVGAAGGLAWYLDADSLTHYAHKRLNS